MSFVPFARSCAFALAIAAASAPALAQDPLKSAVWWNPDESGWGLFVADQGNVLGPFWFTNDEQGRPSWFLAVATEDDAGAWRGDILRFTGVPFEQIAGQAANPPTPVGEASLEFADTHSMLFTYTIDGQTQSKALTRFSYDDQDIVCTAATGPRDEASNYSDLWWNPAQSGWGIHISHLDDKLQAAWYTYDADGRSVYYIGVGERGEDGRFTGTLYLPRDGVPFDKMAGKAVSDGSDEVGEFALSFSDGQNAEFSYTIGAVSQSRDISRFQFGDVAGVCEVQPYAAPDSGGGNDDGVTNQECSPPFTVGDVREVRTTSTADGATDTHTHTETITGETTFRGQAALIEEYEDAAGIYARSYLGNGDRTRFSLGADAFNPATGALITTSVNDPLRIELTRFFDVGQREELNWTVNSTSQGINVATEVMNSWKLLGKESVTTAAGTFNACKFEIEIETDTITSGVRVVTRNAGISWSSPQFGLVKQQTEGTAEVMVSGFGSTSQISATMELLSAEVGGQSTP